MLVLYSACLKVQLDEIAERLHSFLCLKNNSVSHFYLFIFNLNFYHFHELSCLLEMLDSTKLAQGSSLGISVARVRMRILVTKRKRGTRTDGSVQPIWICFSKRMVTARIYTLLCLDLWNYDCGDNFENMN